MLRVLWQFFVVSFNHNVGGTFLSERNITRSIYGLPAHVPGSRVALSHDCVSTLSFSTPWKVRLGEPHNMTSAQHLSITCSTPVKRVDLWEWRCTPVHFWGGGICVCVHNAAIHPAARLSTWWGPAQKQIKSICSCWKWSGLGRLVVFRGWGLLCNSWGDFLKSNHLCELKMDA